MVGIDVSTKRTLKVLDFVKGRSTPRSTGDWAEALFQLTNMVRLFNIRENLKSGWGRYIHDVTMNELGDNAEEKIMKKRKQALKELSSLDENQLERIPVDLRKEIIAQRVLDYEPQVREEYKGLLIKLLRTKDLRLIKLNTHSPMPISVLFSEGNSTLLTFDNFYMDPATARMFDSEYNARQFLIRLAVAVLYCRRKSLESAKDITEDKRAADYSRRLYRLFHKAVAEESSRNIKIGEMLGEYDLVGAAKMLMANDKFYITMKNLAPAILLEFEPGRLHVTSFLGMGSFAFDDYGKEKIVELISRNREAGALYLAGTASIFDYLVKTFSRDEMYLNADFTPASIGRNPWTDRLPFRMTAECTADYEMTDEVPSTLVGLKMFSITFTNGEFIELIKPEEDFYFDPVHHSFLYSTNAMIYPETGVVNGIFYSMPELDVMLAELRRAGRVDKEVIGRANLILAGHKLEKPFEYFEKDGKAGIVGSISDTIRAAPGGGGR